MFLMNALQTNQPTNGHSLLQRCEDASKNGRRMNFEKRKTVIFMVFLTPYWVSGTRRNSNFLLCEAPTPDVQIFGICMIRIARTRSATRGNQSTRAPSLHHRLDTQSYSLFVFSEQEECQMSADYCQLSPLPFRTLLRKLIQNSSSLQTFTISTSANPNQCKKISTSLHLKFLDRHSRTKS